MEAGFPNDDEGRAGDRSGDEGRGGDGTGVKGPLAGLGPGGARSHWLRVLLASVLLVVGALGLGAGAPAWWLGVGLMVAGATLIVAPMGGGWRWIVARLPGDGSAWRGWVLEVLSVGLVVLVATIMLGGALDGRPVSGDHTVHFAKFLEAQSLLGDTGRLLGWSHDLYAGHPMGYQYPFLPDLWLLMFERVLGLTSEVAYGVGIWAFWVVLGLSVYAFGKRAFSRSVGVVGAVAYLTTGGLPHAGGWEYIIRSGVWPQWLAMAFFLIAVSRLDDVVVGRSRRALAMCALLLGLSLLGHQASILAGLIGVVALVLTWLWGPRPKSADGVSPRVGGVAWRLLLVAGLAFLIAASFMLPFLDTRELTDERGNFWATSYTLGEALLSRASIIGELPIIAIGAIAGAALTLVRKPGMLAVFATFYAIVAIVGSHSSTLGELDLLDAADPFRHVIWYRIVELGKPFYFVLAASALVAFARAMTARTAAVPASTRAIWAFALGTVLAPIGGGVATAWWVGELDRDSRVLYEMPNATEREALVRRIRELAPIGQVDPTALRVGKGAQGPDAPGFFRVANLTGMSDRYLSDLGPLIGRPLYKPGFTPVSNYLYKIRAQSTAALTAINVAYAFSDRTLPPMDWEPIESFGPLRLYRFRQFDPRLWRVMGREPTSGELREVASATQVRMVGFTRESMTFEVSNIPPKMPKDALLRINVSAFPRWNATQDGRPVDITTVPLEGHPGTGFMAVPLVSGRVHFEFALSTLDRVGFASTILGLVLVALVVLSQVRRLSTWPVLRHVGLVVDWSGPRSGDERPPRQVFGLSLGTVGVVVLLAAASVGLLVLGSLEFARELAPKAAAEREVTAVLWDAASELDEAEVKLGDVPCRFVLDRFLCRGKDPRFEVARTPAVFAEFEHATCIKLEPEGTTRASATFKDVPPGELSLLVGSRSMHESLPSRATSFRVFVNESLVDEVSLRFRPQRERRLLDLVAKTGVKEPFTLRIEVEAPDEEARNACFFAQVVTTRATVGGTAEP